MGVGKLGKLRKVGEGEKTGFWGGEKKKDKKRDGGEGEMREGTERAGQIDNHKPLQ